MNRGRPRQRTAADDDLAQEDDIFESIYDETGDKQIGAWGLRVQQRNESFQQHRPRNTQRLQQHGALQRSEDQQKQLGNVKEHVSNCIKTAYLRHGCQVLHDEQQQQQQHVEQPCPAVEVVQVVSSRSVACHVLGYSFWQQVPTVRCSCCRQTWEVHPADVGFFSNSPEQPFVWFDSQVLQLYQHLFMSGLSASCFAESLSKIAACEARQDTSGTTAAAASAAAASLLPVDPR